MKKDNTYTLSLHHTVMPEGWRAEASTQLYSVAEITQETPLPPGFGVIQLEDGKFYPLLVEHWEELELIGLDLIPRSLEDQGGGGEKHFRYDTRIEAVQCCYRLLEEELVRSTARWNQSSFASSVYPERCAWYHDIIEAITGEAVYVTEISGLIFARSRSYKCSCDIPYPALLTMASTPYEALEALANDVYANACACCREGCICSVLMNGEKETQCVNERGL